MEYKGTLETFEYYRRYHFRLIVFSLKFDIRFDHFQKFKNLNQILRIEVRPLSRGHHETRFKAGFFCF